MRSIPKLRVVLLPAIALSFFLAGAISSSAADSIPEVSLDSTKSAPRSVESLTQKSIVRDYKLAWASLTQALESNSAAPLTGLFEASASEWLTERVSGQQRSGLTSRYSNQSHKLQAVFYAQEGDVIELHDTAEYDIQILDGSNTIHAEHVLERYVVLMTPGADRWVIRQLQSVPQF